MTDRELLLAAANAAGIRHHETTGDAGVWIAADNPHWWNPLTDDGDALRLAVKLGLLPSIFPGPAGCTMVTAHNRSSIDLWVEEMHEADPYAATRRAIVRAAAEMAK